MHFFYFVKVRYIILWGMEFDSRKKFQRFSKQKMNKIIISIVILLNVYFQNYLYYFSRYFQIF